MPIITIARGTRIGAREVAERVAATLEIPCLSREVVAQAARTAGVAERLLVDVIEQTPSMFEGATYDRAVYLEFVRSTLCEHATDGSFVYHGHAAHLLLPDLPNLLRVRVVASMAYRIAAVVREREWSDARAERYVRKADRERGRWMKFLYGEAHEDLAHYDLIVNVSDLGVHDASAVVCAAAGLPRFQWTEESRAAVRDVALAHRVRAALADSRLLYSCELDVQAEAGRVVISGRARTTSQRTEIDQVAASVPGVTAVGMDIHVPADLLRE